MKTMVARQQATPYQKQRSALAMEFSQFLESTLKRDICSAMPDDVIDFWIWKDNFGKTVVHNVTCPLFGEKSASSRVCPKRLAYASVDSIIGELRLYLTSMGDGQLIVFSLGSPTPQLHRWLSPIYWLSEKNSSSQEPCRDRLNHCFFRTWCFYLQK